MPKRIATLARILIPVAKTPHSFEDGAGNISSDALVGHPLCEAVMGDFIFNPPLRLERGVLVRTLNQAATVARTLIVTRLPGGRDAVVRRLEAAKDPERERDAANAFRVWA